MSNFVSDFSVALRRPQEGGPSSDGANINLRAAST